LVEFFTTNFTIKDYILIGVGGLTLWIFFLLFIKQCFTPSITRGSDARIATTERELNKITDRVNSNTEVLGKVTKDVYYLEQNTQQDLRGLENRVGLLEKQFGMSNTSQ